MRRVTLIIVLSSASLALFGCNRSKVETEQPAAQFKDDVEAKLKDFDSRISEAKAQKAKLSKAQADALETATEMAEEKIETLRDTSLPTLSEVSGKELETLKESINTTLSEIAGQVDQAEQAVEKGLSTEERFQSQTKDQLAELRRRWDRVKEKSQDLGDAAKSKATMALESAEEAIQEADSSLDRYASASKDEAQKIRSNIEGLLSTAKQELTKAEQAGS